MTNTPPTSKSGGGIRFSVHKKWIPPPLFKKWGGGINCSPTNNFRPPPLFKSGGGIRWLRPPSHFYGNYLKCYYLCPRMCYQVWKKIFFHQNFSCKKILPSWHRIFSQKWEFFAEEKKEMTWPLLNVSPNFFHPINYIIAPLLKKLLAPCGH